MHHKAHEKLKMNIEELLLEASRQGWTIDKTKMMLVSLFDLDEGCVRNSKNFRHKLYHHRAVIKDTNFDKHDIDYRLNWDEGEE